MIVSRWLVMMRESLARWRWLAWSGGIALLALIGMLPLRAALSMSNLDRIGFTARQVAGTVWYGRIGEFQLRSQPLGTLEVRLDPAALLVGNIGMRFNRMDSPDGVLRGKLVSGLRRGIVETSGRIAVSDMLAPLPIEAFELNEVTLLFRNGTCVEASGRMTPIVNAPVSGAPFSGLTGSPTCDGERARVVFQGPGGNERIEFYVSSSGSYRAWMSVRNAAPEINAALATAGFRPAPAGMTLSVDGQL
jgi:general secretion pathway protein N